MKKVEIAPNGKIMLVCNHCGNKGGVTKRLLQKYIDYINLRCRTCNIPLDAIGRSKNLGVECNQCKEKMDVNSLWWRGKRGAGYNFELTGSEPAPTSLESY